MDKIDLNHYEDACIAVGVAALAILADGDLFAIVMSDGVGGFIVSGDEEDE